MFQRLDGTLEEAKGLGFWDQYGTMILAGCVCVGGFVGFRAWLSNKSDE
jgi:hypothetical protein